MKSKALTRPAPGGGPNEDSFLADDARGLYLVSDGLGRHRGGDVASRLVVDAVSRALEGPPPEDLRPWLGGAVTRAAQAVQAEALKNPRLRDMSATLTLLYAAGPTYHLVHIGDSRGYLVRRGAVTQITNDHSVAWEQFQIGAITKEALRTHPNQKHLTRTISASRAFALPEFHAGAIQPGDRFLICTDGLTKELSDPELVEADPAALIAEVQRRGGKDDVTIIIACEDR